MSEIKNLKELFINELKDLYSAENQLTEALPKMAEKAKDSSLKSAFEEHLKETENQINRLEKISEQLGEELTGETCKAMKGLIEEGEEIMKDVSSENGVMDAALIAAAQKVEHYEIASYGTVVTYAEQLGEKQIAKWLKETLSEEKNADQKLNKLAKGSINEEAE